MHTLEEEIISECVIPPTCTTNNFNNFFLKVSDNIYTKMSIHMVGF